MRVQRTRAIYVGSDGATGSAGWGEAGCGFDWPSPGTRNISGETVGVALMPLHPPPSKTRATTMIATAQRFALDFTETVDTPLHR